MNDSLAGLFFRLPQALAGRKDLNCTAKVVYSCILTTMREKDIAWPGLRRIARECGIDKHTAFRAVERLDAAGLLVITPGNSHQSNRYVLPEGADKCSRSLESVPF